MASTPFFQSQFDDLVDIQIRSSTGLLSGRRSDRTRFALVRNRDSLSSSELYSDRPDAEFVAGADDPDRDLAAVGDQDSFKPSFHSKFLSIFIVDTVYNLKIMHITGDFTMLFGSSQVKSQSHIILAN